MKTILKIRTLIYVVLAVGALLSTPGADASDSVSYPAYLEAKVIAYLPLSGGIRRMFLQQEGRRQFLYVQQPSQKGVTVIDITKPERPKVVNQVPLENLTMVSFGLAIFETPENSATVGASLATGNAEGPHGSGVLESVRVLDVSDPAHPRTVQNFGGVTSILQDSAQNLFYVANGDGVWIVSHQQVLRRHECGSSDAISPLPNCD
ncbi:MAG TPA: hypothetical protein VMU26_16625 [Candidatus Polarisedimenticolia bacterium]|nr:hypothetical protein [Candidatus Polarisedimenticolia bacterium]